MGKVIIMAGCSGSGKSTFARENYPGANVVSADDYFVGENKEYSFDPSKLPLAHAQCLRAYVDLVQYVNARDDGPLARVDEIVVDNTSTTVAEVAPYAALALAYGHELEVVILRVNPAVAHARNTHDVPLAGVKAQAARLADLRGSLPPWWPVRVVGVE